MQPGDASRVQEVVPLLEATHNADVVALAVRTMQENMRSRLGRDVHFAVAMLEWLLATEVVESPVLMRRRDFEALQRRCHRDPLTALLNRSALYELLEREISASVRHGHAIALLFADLDGFKSYNDSHGHVAGDELLRELGALLDEESRTADVVARYGGDELVIAAPQTNSREALRLARRLQRSVRRRWERDGITMSIGVAIAPRDAVSAEELIAQADDAMYEAKRAGGDAVALAFEEGDRPSVSKA
jgi:diguanylate cyclase (GGDEF)-like protein